RSLDREARHLSSWWRGAAVVPAGTRVDLHDPSSSHRRSDERGPRQEEEEEETRAQVGQDRSGRAHPKRRERMTRILIVEDEPDLADPLAYLLRREGYEVEIAEDGPGALGAFRERGADIVLLDL